MKEFIEAAEEGMKDLLDIAGVKTDGLTIREIRRRKADLKEQGYEFETIGPPYGTHILQRFSFKNEFVAGNYISVDPMTQAVHRTLLQTKEEWDAVIAEIKKAKGLIH